MDGLSNLQSLDPKLFPGFVAAAQLLNFTMAAKRAHMTQSGVSQHVAKLEEQVGVELFKRVGKQVFLTDAGKALLRYIEEQNAIWTEFLETVRSDQQALVGVVSYAMPPSCLLSPHFQMLLARRASEKNIHLSVRLAPSPEVIELIIRNEIHFGFVTQRPENPALDFEHFCNEEYVLASADPDLMAALKPRDLFHHHTIDYPGADVYYNHWLRHHAPDEPRDYYSLMHAGRINVIEGAITMVMGGLGSAVFPRHCIEQQLESGALLEYRSTMPALTNSIYICQIKNAAPVRRVKRVLEWFREIK
ncbi:MAG: transcriptional regulator LysR family protein [Myxococcaceae bacterium]|nr:transcriptional regulator LysR family protein [Myxococcaceae bacterium]